MVSIHPDINKAWELKDEVTDFYVSNTVKTAPEAIETVIKHLRESNIEELVAFSKTLSNWKVEIINSFCISKAEYNVSKDTGEITVEQTEKNQQCTDGKSQCDHQISYKSSQWVSQLGTIQKQMYVGLRKRHRF